MLELPYFLYLEYFVKKLCFIIQISIIVSHDLFVSLIDGLNLYEDLLLS
jgi:hypothetical protein